MPISAASALNVTGSDTDARNYTTASWTPTAGKLYILALGVHDLGGSMTVPTVSGNNITWSRLGNDTGGGVGQPVLVTWYGYAGSSASAGAITFTGVVSSGQTADGAIWGIAELTDANDYVQSVVGSTINDTITVTLASFASTNNATGAWFLSYDNAGGAITNTAGSGFTLTTGLNASQASGGDTMRLSFQFRSDNDTSVDVTASSANDRLLINAFEIRAKVTNTQAVTAVQSQAVTLARKASKPLTAVLQAAINLPKAIKDTLTVTGASAVEALVRRARQVALEAQSAAEASLVRAMHTTVTATTSATASAIKVVSLLRTLLIEVGPELLVGGLARIRRTLTVASTAAATVTKRVSSVLLVPTQAVGSLVRARRYMVTLLSAVDGIGTIGKAVRATVGTTASAVGSVVRKVAIEVRAAGAAVAGLLAGRRLLLELAASVEATAAAFRRAALVLAASVGATADTAAQFIQGSLKVALTATVSAAVSVTKAVKKRLLVATRRILVAVFDE